MLKLFQKFDELFDETLVDWKEDPVYSEFKEGVDPIFSLPYTVPKVHEVMFKNYVEHLVLLGVLELSDDS